MENKEQSSLEKEYVLLICPNCKELLKDENMGKMCPNCKEWTYTYQCKSVLISKTALADQKAKMRKIILYRIKKNNKFSHKLKPCFLQNRGRLLEAKRILKEFEELK